MQPELAPQEMSCPSEELLLMDVPLEVNQSWRETGEMPVP